MHHLNRSIGTRTVIIIIIFDRGFAFNPNMMSFETITFVPDVTSIATIEGTMKVFSIDAIASGRTVTKISMFLPIAHTNN